MDANEIRRQEAERDYLLRVNETGAAYRPVRIDGTPAKGSIAADLKAAQEEIHRLVLQKDELLAVAKRHREERDHYKERWLDNLAKLTHAERLNGELQKELAELRHTGQHMTCGQCEQLRETQKRDVPIPACAACHGAFPGHQPGCPFGYDQP